MNNRSRSGAVIASGAIVIAAPAAWGGIVDFEDVAVDRQDVEHTATGGAEQCVMSMPLDDGGLNGGGAAARGGLDGTGSGVEPSVTFVFNFGTNVSSLSLLYGWFGGDLNITVDGALPGTAPFPDLPGAVKGMDAAASKLDLRPGPMRFPGAAPDIGIDGPAPLLDEPEFTPIPGPSAVTALLVAALVPGRRRRRSG